MVRAAVAAGLRVAPQSTGHNAGPLGRLDDVVIVRTSGMDSVEIDPVRQRARVGGGALWLPVVEAAAAQGFAVLHGSSPDVGVAGYSLGGGIFLYARKLGLQTNSITGVEIVTADGSIVWADATENAELFWALRGGGGNFGIVTALEFAIFPFDTAYAGMLVWDRTETERVLRGWVHWAGRRPRRGDHLVPGAEPAAAARHPGAVPRPPAGGHRRRGAGLRRARRRDPRCTAGSRPGDGHLRPGAGRVAGPAAHGSGGSDARRRRTR